MIIKPIKWTAIKRKKKNKRARKNMNKYFYHLMIQLLLTYVARIISELYHYMKNQIIYRYLIISKSSNAETELIYFKIIQNCNITLR